MALYCDKYRPKTLDSLELHTELTARLGQLLRTPASLPHLLLHGPAGAGKKTRVMAVLRELYGPGVEKLRMEQKQFTLPSKKKLELTTLASPHHIEMTPSDAGSSDRAVVQEVIREIAASVPLDSTIPFKVIVLNEVDSLSRGAQHALRRTMEKYSQTCRLILCSQSTGRVMEPVRSRCLSLRVPAPSIAEVSTLLKKVCRRENLTFSDNLIGRIASECQRNARRALLMLEAVRVKHGTNPDDRINLPVADWEEVIVSIAKDMVEEQSPDRLLKVRGKFYQLLGHCIPPEVIFRRLVSELIKRCDATLQHDVVMYAAMFDSRLRAGSKPIFHLEAFCARFMQLYKVFLNQFLM